MRQSMKRGKVKVIFSQEIVCVRVWLFFCALSCAFWAVVSKGAGVMEVSKRILR